MILVTIAILSGSTVLAEESAEVDASGDVTVEETRQDDDSATAAAREAAAAAAQAAAQAAAVEEAAAEEAAARRVEEAKAEAQAAAAKLKAEAEAKAAAMAEEPKKDAADTKSFASDVTESVKGKAMGFFDKAKEISPEKVKKIAAGGLGVWGVAAGAGWVMNNMGGDQ